jgi:sarcosine oxidase, subunit beta
MENTFDAIVVGSGYIGCSVAHHLCASGLKTALFDMGPLAAGASRANYGNIQIQDLELGKSVELIRMARTRFANLEAELDCKVGLRRIGGLLLIENKAQWKLMESRLGALWAAGISSELVPAQRLREVEPFIDPAHLLGGLYHADEGQVDPFQLMRGYLVQARRRGLRECYFTEVTGFEVQNGRLRGIVTTEGRFSAGSVILCTGAYTRRLGRELGRDWDIHNVLGQAMVTEPVAPVLRNHLSTAAFFQEEASGEAGAVHASFAVGQSPHGHLLLGEGMYEAGHFQRHVPAQSFPAVAACVLSYFPPSFRRLRVWRGWSAPVAGTSDGRPLLGPVAGVEGLYLATAFRSTVIVTPLAGEIMAQLVTQGKCVLNIDDFLPERNRQHAN